MNTMTEVAERRRHARLPAVTVMVGALGFAAATAQLALAREFIAVFSGDELTVGITLSCWLTLTAAGTWWGTLAHRRHHPVRLLGGGTLALAVYAIAAVLLVRAARNAVFLRGAAVDPVAVGALVAVVLAPFCLGSGALLTVASHTLLREGDRAAIGRVYAADAAGAIFGAVVFTFLFSSRFDHAVTLCWSAVIIGLVIVVAAWWRRSFGLVTTSLATALVLGAVAVLGRLDDLSLQWLYHSPVVYRATSPYGRLVVTRDAGQLTFYENGFPAAFTGNAVQAEEIVHYALAQRPHARSVLLVGGTIAGTAIEVLQYPAIRRVTVVEIDPAITVAARRFLPGTVNDPRIHLVDGDARRFIAQTDETFDAILIALPDPTTYQLNRYYTAEFFAAAKRVLAPGGVVAFGCSHYENVVTPELRQIIASARLTLGRAFRQGLVLPGARIFFLGSDGPLTADIATALERNGIAPLLVNRHYLDATLAGDRRADVEQAANKLAPVNRDFRPVLYLLRLRQWLDQFAFPAGGLALGLGGVLTLAYVRLRSTPRLIFAAGFAGSALEMVLLVAVQTFYGSLYQQIGAVIAIFMLGLAAGAAWANRAEPLRPRRTVAQLGTAIAAVSVGLALALPRIAILDGVTGWPVGLAFILGSTLLLAMLMGAQFAIGSATATSILAKSAPRVFSADLIGAAAGGLAASAFLLPAFGAGFVCLLTAGLNATAAALSSLSHRDA